MSPVRTIMIIDDDDDDRNLFTEALLEVNNTYQLIAAINGEHALEIIKRPDFIPPEFIFLDLNMPRMNGWQCLFHLRNNKDLKKTPIIIYTTSRAKEDVDKAKSCGATYVLTKPSRFRDLVHAIFYVLNTRWEN